MSSLALRPVDPARDAAMLHSWVGAERAAFWGMREHTAEDVREVYAWITAQDHLRAFLVGAGDRPLGLFQTYDPALDEIGSAYARRPGDLGLHLFLADDPARAGRTRELVTFVLDTLFDAGVERVVLEPDARNAASLALLDALGAQAGPVARLELSYMTKDARFTFFPRPAGGSGAGGAGAGGAAAGGAAAADVVLPRSWSAGADPGRDA